MLRKFLRVTTQGETIEEALDNIKEAVELYLEEKPELKEELGKLNVVSVEHEIVKIVG